MFIAKLLIIINNLLMTTKYFKITNVAEKHYDYQYRDGLNIFDGKFNDDPQYDYGPGGLYITTLKNIALYYNFGVWLREVILPLDDLDFKMIEIDHGRKYRVNRLILGQRYYLLDPDTITKFKLPIDNYFIDTLCKLSDIKTLQKWTDQGLPLIYSDNIIDHAINRMDNKVLQWFRQLNQPLNFNISNLSKVLNEGGCLNLEILEWCKKYDLIQLEDKFVHKINYDYNSLSNINYETISVPRWMDMASINDCVDVLEWWKKSGLPLIYTKESMDLGGIKALDWWLHSGLKLIYTRHAIDFAWDDNHIDKLEWWKKSGLKLKYSNLSIDQASGQGYLKVLNWWEQSDLPLCYTEQTMDRASENNFINVLDWWQKSGLQLFYTEQAMDQASAKGYLNILKWWKQSKLSLKYSEKALNQAFIQDHMNVLEWWTQSGLKLKYDSKLLEFASLENDIKLLDRCQQSGLKFGYSNLCIDQASEKNLINVLNWWQKSGLELLYTEQAMNQASIKGYIDILKWWKQSGLKLKYTNEAINHNHINILEWWTQSGLKLKHDETNFKNMPYNTQLWWQKYELSINKTYINKLINKIHWFRIIGQSHGWGKAICG